MTVALLAGGGTAGHVNPLLAVAERWRAEYPGDELVLLGTSEGLEARLVPERGFVLTTIPRVPFPRRLNRAAFSFPARFAEAVRRSRRIIRERDVDVVLGFGGYASAPAYVAAWRERVPIVAHEANARPGIANRLARALGADVGVTFPVTPLRSATVVGMPLRTEIASLDRTARRDEARQYFGLDLHAPVLLVTGGSTGARRLNDTLTASADDVLEAGWQVLHITGSGRGGEDPGRSGYVTLEYCDRMDLAYASADLALCRSGAATVSELSAVGLPAVFVPYAVGNGEQALNARAMVDIGAALLVDDAAVTVQWVGDELVPLLRDRPQISRMTEAARHARTVDAAGVLVTMARDSARPRKPIG